VPERCRLVLAHDASRGQPFWTPALLAATLLDGLETRKPSTSRPDWSSQYTVVHWLAFLIFGLLTATVLAAADREPGCCSWSSCCSAASRSSRWR